MKNLFNLLGLVLLMAALIFAVGACGNTANGNPDTDKDSGDGDDFDPADIKTLAIWVSPEIITSFYDITDANRHPVIEALGWGTVSDNTLVVDLKKPFRVEGKYNTFDNQPAWTGTGDYYIYLIPITKHGGTADYNGSGAFDYWEDEAKVFSAGGSAVKKTLSGAKDVSFSLDDFAAANALAGDVIISDDSFNDIESLYNDFASRFANCDMIIIIKFVDGKTPPPDNHKLDEYDWSKVEEGKANFMWHGKNGDGDELWQFIAKDGGDRYEIYINNDAAGDYFLGLTKDPGYPEQRWWYRGN